MASLHRGSLLPRYSILLCAVAALAFGIPSWLQVQREFRFGVEDLDRRARTIAYRMGPSASRLLQRPEADAAGPEDLELEGHRRLLGLVVYGPDGKPRKAGNSVSEIQDAASPAVSRLLAGEREAFDLVRMEDSVVHVAASRVESAGILAVLHDASYLDARAAEGRFRVALSTLALTIGLAAAMMGITWFVYERPMLHLTEWMRRVRLENVGDAPPPALRHLDLATETDRLAASLRAARSGSGRQSRDLLKNDAMWTRERLRAHATDLLRSEPLGVVSNREPYMHQVRDGKPQVVVPASGLVTALDPVLQACGGFWVAHGSGDADVETSDRRGRLTVPPGDSRYTLRRVWLSREEEQGYYYGFSNEGLWPLCHLAHERPVFRAEDWRRYVDANRRFADATLEECGSGKGVILVQDYHLALVPLLLKTANPSLKVGLFWHIPWPTAEAFRICPWREEILRGMLGADLVGFHLQQHCNNFLSGVDRMVEARLDWDQFSAELQGHRTRVRPFPISVQSWADREARPEAEIEQQIREFQEKHRLSGQRIAVGVDRIDYTKGLPERFRAMARLFEMQPDLRGKVTFVQLGAPSRTHIPRYRELVAELEKLADEINWRFQTDSWKPIRFLVGHHDGRTVHAFLRMSEVCIVSSLHDGMNLVAKEYVAARTDGDGVLVLSEFAGAAQELSGALPVNPYDTEQFARALRQAVSMPEEERRERMARMRKIVEERNVYRWAADFLAVLAESERPSAVHQPLAPGQQYLPDPAVG